MSFHQIDRAGNLPSLEVSIDFTNDPTNVTRVWTDITTDVRDLSYIRSGRNDVLQHTSTGSLRMILNNRAGNYDPMNISGTYYPGVKRMRWIRVRAQWSGVTYNRWQGLITAWNQQWPGSGKDATVEVTAADALKVLSLYDLVGKAYGAQTTDARVTAVLADVGISGTATVGASSVVSSGTFTSGVSALSHLQDVEDTENGRLFAAGDATITFQDRHYRLQHSAATSGTIGDAAGEIPYRETSLASDDANIWNRVMVTESGGTAAQTAIDSTSGTSYFQRTLTRTILSSSQTEALSAAQYLTQIYGDPSPKLPALTLIPAKATSTWPTVLAADISQRFLFRRRAAAGISLYGFVEQLGDAIVVGNAWDVNLQMLPAADQSFWVLGDSTYGLLGQTTVLGY